MRLHTITPINEVNMSGAATARVTKGTPSLRVGFEAEFHVNGYRASDDADGAAEEVYELLQQAMTDDSVEIEQSVEHIFRQIHSELVHAHGYDETDIGHAIINANLSVMPDAIAVMVTIFNGIEDWLGEIDDSREFSIETFTDALLELVGEEPNDELTITEVMDVIREHLEETDTNVKRVIRTIIDTAVADNDNPDDLSRCIYPLLSQRSAPSVGSFLMFISKLNDPAFVETVKKSLYGGDIPTNIPTKTMAELIHTVLQQSDDADNLVSSAGAATVKTYDDGMEDIAEMIRDSIEIDIGDVATGYGNAQRFDDEYSLDTDAGGVELVSPPLPIDTALADIRKVFNFIDENGSTPHECGFHVSASIEGMDSFTDLQRLKLIMVLGEGYALELFGRENNHYTKSFDRAIADVISDAINTSFDAGNVSSGDVANKVIEAFRTGKSFGGEKYQSINFGKLNTSTPYLEMRIMGGENYHTKFDDVKATIMRFTTALISVMDGSADADFYRKLVKRIEKQMKSRGYHTNQADADTSVDGNKLLLAKCKVALSRWDAFIDGLMDDKRILASAPRLLGVERPMLVKPRPDSILVDSVQTIDEFLNVKFDTTYVPQRAVRTELAGGIIPIGGAVAMIAMALRNAGFDGFDYAPRTKKELATLVLGGLAAKMRLSLFSEDGNIAETPGTSLHLLKTDIRALKTEIDNMSNTVTIPLTTLGVLFFAADDLRPLGDVGEMMIKYGTVERALIGIASQPGAPESKFEPSGEPNTDEFDKSKKVAEILNRTIDKIRSARHSIDALKDAVALSL